MTHLIHEFIKQLHQTSYLTLLLPSMTSSSKPSNSSKPSTHIIAIKASTNDFIQLLHYISTSLGEQTVQFITSSFDEAARRLRLNHQFFDSVGITLIFLCCVSRNYNIYFLPGANHESLVCGGGKKISFARSEFGTRHHQSLLKVSAGNNTSLFKVRRGDAL